jgi:hypothetical protein
MSQAAAMRSTNTGALATAVAAGPGPRCGDAAVDTACGRALDLDVGNVTKIASMLERGVTA